MKVEVYIAGEDDATKAIIKRALAYCSDKIEIISELPARGGQVKSQISAFNKLSETHPVVLLIDADAATCAPLLLNELIRDKNKNFILNIAVDEAEAWLMADREGFAEYFKLELDDMPVSHKTKQGGRKELAEMSFAYKSSMYLTHELIRKSKNSAFIQQLAPKKHAAKGPEYNSCMLPFIQDKWDIDNARKNSDSLNRMIVRLENLVNSNESK
jgi:hypothetical protein